MSCLQMCPKIDARTYSSAPFPRLHLGWCCWRHGPVRRAHISSSKDKRQDQLLSPKKCVEYVYIYVLWSDSPIFVRALLLHFDGFIQLAVWGAKIVISLHPDPSTVVHSTSEAFYPDARQQRVDLPGAPAFEALSFPTVSFQDCFLPTGAGIRGPAANHKAGWGLSDRAGGPSKSRCALKNLRAGTSCEDSLCHFFLPFMKVY